MLLNNSVKNVAEPWFEHPSWASEIRVSSLAVKSNPGKKLIFNGRDYPLFALLIHCLISFLP